MELFASLVILLLLLIAAAAIAALLRGGRGETPAVDSRQEWSALDPPSTATPSGSSRSAINAAGSEPGVQAPPQ
jgi:hypothetical protein